MVSTGNPLYAKLTIFAELNYLLFVSTRLAKQTAPCQSGGDEPQKCVRLFRYSYWLLRT